MKVELGPYIIEVKKQETKDYYVIQEKSLEEAIYKINNQARDFLFDLGIDYRKPASLYKYNEDDDYIYYRGHYKILGEKISGPQAYRLEIIDEVENYIFTGQVLQVSEDFYFYLDVDEKEEFITLEFNYISKRP